MSISERKKALRKAKKAELKIAENNTSAAEKSQDEDPFGLKYLQGDHLTNSMPFLTSLLDYSPEYIETQVYGALIYMRKSNFQYFNIQRNIF